MLKTFSLNALRAFEASFRYLNFTRAGEELGVTQAAVSHRVKELEAHLGAKLFRRTTRGLVATDEALLLAPSVTESFERMEKALSMLASGEVREIISVSAVSTFAVGFLIDRLNGLRASHPNIDIRLQTNNNLADLITETLDFGIRYGDGAWQSVNAEKLIDAPLTVLCTPKIASALERPSDLARQILLRSFRGRDWPDWLNCAGVAGVTARGPIFDSSIAMIQSALRDAGVALAPAAMFHRELARGALVQPFDIAIGNDAYWLTYPKTKPLTHGGSQFRSWLLQECKEISASA